MEKKKPIRRHPALRPLSRDHHEGLLLCWKIRTGFRKNIDTDRMKKYAEWFFTHHLLPHFEEEENVLFPVLGHDHEMVKRAVTEHRRLTRLFKEESDNLKSLMLIEEELESHIRFEERILFNIIQEQPEIAALHEGSQESDTKPPEWHDEFWK